MVPVLREEKIGLSINILYSFLTLSGVIIVFIVCARYFKFPIDEWSPFNLYSLMLGIGVNMEPRYSIRSIIMFLALFTVSFFFVSDLVSDLTTLNYKTEETEMVKSIQDILKKDFEVILKEENLERKRQRYVLLYMVELGDYKRISNMITPPGHAETNTLKKIFILPENDAEKLLEVNKNMINGIKYKISEELLMYQSYYVIPFEFNSILRIKFHEIYTRILEAGLDVKWRSDYEYANKIDKRLTPDESDDDDNTFILVLILVMVIGTIISTIVLLIEIVWYYWLEKRLQKISVNDYFKDSTFIQIDRSHEYIPSHEYAIKVRKLPKKANVHKIRVQPKQVQRISNL